MPTQAWAMAPQGDTPALADASVGDGTRSDATRQETNSRYPFLAYGKDWLAFAHLIFAILFIGPLRDLIKNIWVIEFGIIACLGVIPLALIASQFPGIPLGWHIIDCSFGPIASGPLWNCRRAVHRISVDPKKRTSHPIDAK